MPDLNGVPGSSRPDTPPAENVLLAEAAHEGVPLVEEPDWKTTSDEAFLAAARAVLERNAALLKRLA
jgi:hypothetical protein